MNNIYERGILELASTPELQLEVIQKLEAALALQGKKPRAVKNKFNIVAMDLDV